RQLRPAHHRVVRLRPLYGHSLQRAVRPRAARVDGRRRPRRAAAPSQGPRHRGALRGAHCRVLRAHDDAAVAGAQGDAAAGVLLDLCVSGHDPPDVLVVGSQHGGRHEAQVQRVGHVRGP
ncbi:hypothetical protein BN1723_019679, partial [Verticillium longisporum]